MSALSIRGLRVDYGDQPVLRDINLDLESGDYACLLGRSGSGKSTLLAAVAGFVRPSAGQILIDGETASNADQGVNRPPHQRGLGMVFQDANLWPHLDVMDNILFPLRSRGLGRSPMGRGIARARGSYRIWRTQTVFSVWRSTSTRGHLSRTRCSASFGTARRTSVRS